MKMTERILLQNTTVCLHNGVPLHYIIVYVHNNIIIGLHGQSHRHILYMMINNIDLHVHLGL